MIPHSALMLFLSTFHGATAGSSLIAREHQPDSQTIAAYEISGMCLYYYTSRQPNWHKGIEPCIKYCADNGGHGYSEVGTNNIEYYLTSTYLELTPFQIV